VARKQQWTSLPSSSLCSCACHVHFECIFFTLVSHTTFFPTCEHLKKRLGGLCRQRKISTHRSEHAARPMHVRACWMRDRERELRDQHMPMPIDSKSWSWYQGAVEHPPEHLTETHMPDISVFFFTCNRQKGIHPQAPGRSDPLLACLQGLRLPSRRGRPGLIA
jgi:hypothetical protein